MELNPDNLPKVLINNSYHAKVSRKRLQKSDKEFINDCVQSANWLVKSLHQRATTIIKVASEIVLQQDAFFRFGVQHLKPLVLRDVAEVIGMHESTVSRVTNSKLILTEWGVMPLKNFFSASISGSENSELHAASAVRETIKSLDYFYEDPLNRYIPVPSAIIIANLYGKRVPTKIIEKYIKDSRDWVNTLTLELDTLNYSKLIEDKYLKYKDKN